MVETTKIENTSLPFTTVLSEANVKTEVCYHNFVLMLEKTMSKEVDNGVSVVSPTKTNFVGSFT